AVQLSSRRFYPKLRTGHIAIGVGFRHSSEDSGRPFAQQREQQLVLVFAVVSYEMERLAQAHAGGALTLWISIGSAEVDTSGEQGAPDPLVSIGEKVGMSGVRH